MKKRGSHVGVMLSFVIFVTFIVYLYAILDPVLRTQKDKQSILDSLGIGLIEEFQEDLTSISLSTKKSKDCIEVENFFNGLDFTNNKKIIVKDKDGLELDEGVDGDNLHIGNVPEDGTFFKVYYSEEFIEKTPIIPCNKKVKEGDYSIESTTVKTYIFESKVKALEIKYETSDAEYNLLKTELKIPDGTEFGFKFLDSSKVPQVEASIKDISEISIAVYAKTIPITYVDADANTKFGYLNLWVW